MTTLRTRQFRKEDFPGLLEADPKWEDFLAAFNALGKQLEQILNKGAGQDNLNTQVNTMDVPANPVFPLKIKSTVKGKPIGVVAMRVVKTTNLSAGEPPGQVWSQPSWSMDGATVLINDIGGLFPSQKWQVTFLIVGP